MSVYRLIGKGCGPGKVGTGRGSCEPAAGDEGGGGDSDKQSTSELNDFIDSHEGGWDESSMSPADIGKWDAAFENSETTERVPEPPGYVDRKEGKPKPDEASAESDTTISPEDQQTIKDNDQSQQPMSIQEIAAAQDWHGQVMADRSGKPAAPPETPEDTASATKFISSLFNPDMGGTSYLDGLLDSYGSETAEPFPEGSPGSVLTKLISKLAPDWGEGYSTFLAHMLNDLYGDGAKDILETLAKGKKSKRWKYVGKGRFKHLQYKYVGRTKTMGYLFRIN